MTTPDPVPNAREALDIFQKLDALFDTPAKWTRGVGSRNAFNLQVTPDDKDAVCWCLLGAYCKVLGRYLNFAYSARIVLKPVIRARGIHAAITEFNDDYLKSFEDLKLFLEEGINYWKQEIERAVREHSDGARPATHDPGRSDAIRDHV